MANIWKEVFYRVCDPEVYLDSENIRKLISQALGGEVKATCNCPNEIASNIRKEAEAETARLRAILGNIADRKARHEAQTHLLVQCAPMATTFGAPLQGLSAPSVFEDSVHLRLMTLIS